MKWIRIRPNAVDPGGSGSETLINIEIIIIFFYQFSLIFYLSYREVIELPLLNPELFMRVGITPPKVSLKISVGQAENHFLNS